MYDVYTVGVLCGEITKYITMLCVGFAKTVCLYIHHMWSYIWWFPCQKYRMYAVYKYIYIWLWPTLSITGLLHSSCSCHVKLLIRLNCSHMPLLATCRLLPWHMHTHTHTHTHVHTHTHKHTQTCICCVSTHARINTHTHAHAHTKADTHTQADTRTRKHAHLLRQRHPWSR